VPVPDTGRLVAGGGTGAQPQRQPGVEGHGVGVTVPGVAVVGGRRTGGYAERVTGGRPVGGEGRGPGRGTTVTVVLRRRVSAPEQGTRFFFRRVRRAPRRR
jgi:hypothetical protein